MILCSLKTMGRTKSYLLIAILYMIAFATAFFTVRILPLESFLLKVLIADIVATMFIFAMTTLFDNSSIYDPYWSVAPLLILPFFINTLTPGTIVLLAIVYLWGTRLTLNWGYTFTGMKAQDWRYDHYRNRYPRLWPLVNLFGIQLMPTLIVFTALLPAILYLQTGGTLNALGVLGATLSVTAVIIQTVADIQMHRFRKNAPKGRVNDTGLWRYSRHPNYLGEIGFWFGLYIMQLSVAPAYYLSGIGFLLMVMLFTGISIPLMETRQLERKADYERYKAATSPLLLMRPSETKTTEAATE